MLERDKKISLLLELRATESALVSQVWVLKMDSRPYICDFCQISIFSKETLIKHLQSHINRTKLFPCHICSLSFTRKANCKIHITKKHLHVETKKFSCEKCDRVFERKTDLRRHNSNSHNNVRNHECNICFQKFKQNWILKRHKQVHEKERKPLTSKSQQCEICGATFAALKTLIKHQRLHNNGNYYGCEDCDLKFATAYEAKKHAQLHRSWACSQLRWSWACFHATLNARHGTFNARYFLPSHWLLYFTNSNKTY